MRSDQEIRDSVGKALKSADRMIWISGAFVYGSIIGLLVIFAWLIWNTP